jgi:regulatory protein
MQITAIKTQIKRAGRYSIFVDGAYSFSLSDIALLESKLVVGQELTAEQVKEYKQLSDDDKLYGRVLQYVALRPRSEWEIKTYMERKKASPALVPLILNKLSINGYVDDRKFAEAFVRDRQLLRPTSKRKLQLELRKKNVPSGIIQEVIAEEGGEDSTALQEIITSKRRQSKYQDDLKLMQYLSRQGFGYGDIKAALQIESED